MVLLLHLISEWLLFFIWTLQQTKSLLKHLPLTPGMLFSVCFASNGSHALTPMCPHFSSLPGSVRPQDSLAAPTSSSGTAAERANMSFLWRLCVSGQLVYSHHSSTAELPCMERHLHSSYPRRSFLAELRWSSPIWTENKPTTTHQTHSVINSLWCSFHTVEVLCVCDIQPCYSSQSLSLTLPVTMLTCHRWVHASFLVVGSNDATQIIMWQLSII